MPNMMLAHKIHTFAFELDDTYKRMVSPVFTPKIDELTEAAYLLAEELAGDRKAELYE